MKKSKEKFFLLFCLLVLFFTSCQASSNSMPVNTIEGFKATMRNFDGYDCFLAYNNVQNPENSKVYLKGSVKTKDNAFAILDQKGLLLDSVTYNIYDVLAEQQTLIIADENKHPMEVKCTIALAVVANTCRNEISSGNYYLYYCKSDKGKQILMIVNENEVNKNPVKCFLFGKIK